MTQFPSVPYILPEYFSVPGPRLLPIFLLLLFNLDKEMSVPLGTQNPAPHNHSPTPSPRPGLAPFLPLLQGYRATLPGWLPPAPLLSCPRFPSQPSQHEEEAGASG